MFSGQKIWFPYTMGEIVKNEKEMCKSAGKALQIISIQDDKFTLNERNLKEILLHPNAKNKPVYILNRYFRTLQLFKQCFFSLLKGFYYFNW